MLRAQIATIEGIDWNQPMSSWTPEQRAAVEQRRQEQRAEERRLEQRLARHARRRYERIVSRERRAELATIALIRRQDAATRSSRPIAQAASSAHRPAQPAASSRSRRPARRRSGGTSRSDPDLADPDPPGPPRLSDLPWPKLALRARKWIRETDPPVADRCSLVVSIVEAIALQEGRAA